MSSHVDRVGRIETDAPPSSIPVSVTVISHEGEPPRDDPGPPSSSGPPALRPEDLAAVLAKLT